ncbi:Nop52 domain-containing protein [Cephalotus follicularis]|uniref:Nop52 domain-containing protein n=1 Tax=Cephalotus follicularis TaxID=3775 RepID=A0A1Q3DCW9_CEPFO|nr:Nop52 domain-containing protein [Cephalotus follicularis]
MEVAKLEAVPPLIKQLASCDKATRDKSVQTLLKSWLPNQTHVSDEDMKKIWKGLFYCVWHADKLPVQTHLIERLSSVLPSLHFPLGIHYFSVFFLTMRREWSGIDSLRLDKFYLLIRRFLHFFFLSLKNIASWDLDIVSRFMGVLVEGTFFANDKFQGNGVNYHVASVFVEELRPFLPLRKEIVEVLFRPFVSVMGLVPDKVLLGKIKSNVFDVFLEIGRQLLEVRKSGAVVDPSNDVVVLGSIGLVIGFSSYFYELGSSADCSQGIRKVAFALHEEFLKLEKDLASSGIVIEISFPQVNGEDDDREEVPKLIPIAHEMEFDASEGGANGPSNKILKKCKKAKKVSGKGGKKTKKTKKDMVFDLNTESSSLDRENPVNQVISNDENLSVERISDENIIMFNESVMSNLQMQFEKVAAEVGMDNHIASACDMPNITANGTVSKKRRRANSRNGKHTQKAELTDQEDAEVGGTDGEKGAKKVRFSMKNNLVWKPHSPLPPQNLRIPPSVTPRGSALKKGVPPGPIREMPPAAKKMKRTKGVKKGRKVMKNIVPAIKRLKKLKSLIT